MSVDYLSRNDAWGTAQSSAACGSPHRDEVITVRKPNYEFEKRRKELERKAKKEARREEQRLRRGQADGAGETPPDAASPLIPGEESKPVE